MYNHRRHLTIATLLVIVFTFVVYWLIMQLFGNRLMVAAVEEAVLIDQLFNLHWWVIAFLFSLIVVFSTYSFVVFRRRPGDETAGEYMHGNTALEIAWTIAPIGVVLVFAFLGSNYLIDITDAKEDNVAWKVEVTGKKWAWLYTYPDGTQLSSLVVPVDVPVLLELESTDIIHSFWIPEFRVKQDLLPGAKKYLRFTPTLTSEEIIAEKFKRDGIRNYRVQVRCAEICGTSHAYMLSNVFSVGGGIAGATAEVTRIANDIPELSVDRGAFWYTELGCATCHSLDGSLDNFAGPTWLGVYEREEKLDDGTSVIADDAYLRQSIYQPNAQIVEGYAANVMPQDFEAQFAAREASLAERGRDDIDIVADLIEFMKTIGE